MDKRNGQIVSVIQDWRGELCIMEIIFADGHIVELKLGERSYRLWNILQEATESGKDYAY